MLPIAKPTAMPRKNPATKNRRRPKLADPPQPALEFPTHPLLLSSLVFTIEFPICVKGQKYPAPITAMTLRKSTAQAMRQLQYDLALELRTP